MRLMNGPPRMALATRHGKKSFDERGAPGRPRRISVCTAPGRSTMTTLRLDGGSATGGRRRFGLLGAAPPADAAAGRLTLAAALPSPPPVIGAVAGPHPRA